MRRAALVVILLGAACSGDDDPPAATTADGLLECEGDGGTFGTAMESCDEAFEVGQRIAVELGAATADGSNLVFTSTCSVMQGDQTMTADPTSIALAIALVDEGVCPGDVEMLVPD